MALTINQTSTLYQVLRAMDSANTQRSLAMTRLATGLRINRGADDPAGLISLLSLQSDLSAVDASLANNSRTESMLNVADGSLKEVSSLVRDIQGLALASADSTLSASEKAANQAQIDSALDSIDRIIGGSSFNGSNVFGGKNGINVQMSVADAAAIKDVRVYSKPSTTGNVTLSVNVTAAAKHATTSGTSIANITTPLSAQTTISLTGKDGTAAVTFAQGTKLSGMVAAINDSKSLTGVSATSSGTQLKLTSIDYGSEAFVSVSAISGDTDVTTKCNVGRVAGTDAAVTVNGQATLTSGTEIYYNGSGVNLTATLAQNTTGTRTITITGGGATFQLGTASSARETIGIGYMDTTSLGKAGLGYLSDLRSGGSASVTKNAAAAVAIAREAGQQVATTSARVGGFNKYAVQAMSNSLTAQQEGLTSAISDVGDADMAVESARLQRSNLLASTAVSLVGIMQTQQQLLLKLFG
jgi:flagellin